MSTKRRMPTRILLAMSGGIDSAVSACLLKEQGYSVTGLFLKLTDTEDSSNQNRLEIISQKLGIEILQTEARQLFREEVISYFTSLHLAGLTPSPCVQCNPAVKWKVLAQQADILGIHAIATGHYIRIEPVEGHKRIYRATDKQKDQSYYLWNLDREIINRAITPLGHYTKKQVFREAINYNLNCLTEYAESTGLCFSNGRNTESLLSEYCPDLSEGISAGDIVDRNGTILGTHKGYAYYTIGQKRGLNIAGNKHLCVAAIEPKRNRLIADTWESLYTKQFTVCSTRFYDISELSSAGSLKVMIRGFGLNPRGNCRLEPLDSNRYRVILDERAWAPAPGQPAVFYQGDKLTGGGLITFN